MKKLWSCLILFLLFVNLIVTQAYADVILPPTPSVVPAQDEGNPLVTVLLIALAIVAVSVLIWRIRKKNR